MGNEGRSATEQVLIRVPALGHCTAALVARLPPGSDLRRRYLAWALRHSFQAAARGDDEFVLLGYEPDMKFSVFGAGGMGLDERYSGHQGWREYLGDLRANFRDMSFSLRRIFDDGSHVAFEMEFRAAGITSGAEAETALGMALWIAPNGKIERQEIYWQDGWDQALKAINQSA